MIDDDAIDFGDFDEYDSGDEEIQAAAAAIDAALTLVG
eukprot:gene9484-22559_t